MLLGRLLLRTSTVNKMVSRNAYTASKPDPSKPNMLRVGLAFGSTAVLWALLFKQHSTDVLVPRRLMSSVPGGSGDNILYAILCGGAFAGSLTYVYKTVVTDKERFADRISEISARPKSEWTPKPWPPKSGEDGDE